MPQTSLHQATQALLAGLVDLAGAVNRHRRLMRQAGVDAVGLFRRMDVESKGILRESDFRRVMGSEGESGEAASVFAWFDCLRLGQVSKKEFLSFLQPHQCTSQTEQGRQIDRIEHQMDSFSSLLAQMTRREQQISLLRKMVLTNKHYSLPRVMELFNAKKTGIRAQTLCRFLHNVYEFNEISALIHMETGQASSTISTNRLKQLIEGSCTEEYLSKVQCINSKEYPTDHNNPHTRQHSVTQPDFQSVPVDFEYARLMKRVAHIHREAEAAEDYLRKIEAESDEVCAQLSSIKARKKQQEYSFSKMPQAVVTDAAEVDTIIDKYRLRERSISDRPSCVSQRKRLIKRYKGIKTTTHPYHHHESSVQPPTSSPTPRTLLQIGDIRVVESQRAAILPQSHHSSQQEEHCVTSRFSTIQPQQEENTGIISLSAECCSSKQAPFKKQATRPPLEAVALNTF